MVHRTRFEPRRHGFAFANTWPLDDAERGLIDEYVMNYVTLRGTLGRAGRWLAPRVLRLLRRRLERHLAPTFGLCGGMVFAALDFLRAGFLPSCSPAGSDVPAPGSPLRRYIWWRQLDTLREDGARFALWTSTQRVAPRLLLASARREWRALTAALERDAPVPLGLVREARNVFDNHQVLAIGYEDLGGGRVLLLLYDPNWPGQEAPVTLEFGRMLEGHEACAPGLPPLRGFFREAYRFVDPRPAL